MNDTTSVRGRSPGRQGINRTSRISAARSEKALHAFLAKEMRSLSAVPSRTKRSAARLTLVSAMREGLLPPGAGLPPEKELAVILDVSLGTVQAALQQLQQTGTIIRRRGDGTRVASVEPLSDLIWHFRFRDKETSHPLRFVKRTVDVTEDNAHGPWSEFLGDCPRCVRIARRMYSGANSFVYAEMYLDVTRASGLGSIDPAELDTVNIRPYLEETFGIRTAWARHTIAVRSLTRKEASGFGLDGKAQYFEIHAKAFAADGTPVYFQRIFADCANYILDF